MGDKLDEFLDSIMGFKNIIAYFVLLTIVIVFRCKNLIDGNNFADLMKNVTLGFFGATSVQHFTLMARQYLNSNKNQITNPLIKTVEKDIVGASDGNS